MDSTQYTLKETKILEAVPKFPNDRNALPKDVLLLAAYDFIDYFRKSVQAFEESHRDERYKPCMSQKLHADTIYKMIETRSPNPLYPDKNIVYQVYFIVGCLMGVPDHRRSWWEENFAIGIGDYLDKTYHFQGCKSLIQALVRDLLKLSQYEFDFDAVDQDASTATQTIQLRQQLQYQPIVAITPQPAKPENKTLKDMNQQNNNSTVYNGPVTINQGPVYQGCTFNTTNNTYGAPSSSSAATNESQSQPSSPAPDVRTELSPADKAILAVHNAGICEPSDWAAVIRLFKELEMMQPNGQPFDAAYINRVCGKPVTSESSISRSIMSTKIGGKYPYWRIKQDEETRQTPNKLRLYIEIGRIATGALQ